MFDPPTPWQDTAIGPYPLLLLVRRSSHRTLIVETFKVPFAPQAIEDIRWVAEISAIALLALGLSQTMQAQTAICNCPPEWADWASQLKAIKDTQYITVPPDNKHSVQFF